MTDKEAEWAEFRESAEEEGLSAYTERLVQICVPSLRLVPDERSELRSRIGGSPDVPADFEWPRSSTGEPLTFVAQIDLAEVRAAGLPTADVLPERGLLSFFHGYEPSTDADHVGNAGRVLFFDGLAPLAPARAPEPRSGPVAVHVRVSADAPPEAMGRAVYDALKSREGEIVSRLHGLFGDGAEAEAPEPSTAIPRIPISFDLQTEELPPLESPFYANLLADVGASDRDPYPAAFEVFGGFVSLYGQRGVRDEDERPVHRLLGYADPLQADVYLCTEGNATRLPLDAWNTRDHCRAAARWRLLLQIDSDPARDVLFGDGGVLAFMIHEDELAARRFDRCWVEWQSC